MKKEFNFKNIKVMLSRDEMKQIKGGSGGGCLGQLVNKSIIVCKDGHTFTSPNQCSNSVGACNSNGGFDYCYCQ